MTNICSGVFLVLLLATPAFAAQDCSKMEPPATPVKGVVGGKPFVPKDASIHINKDGFEQNDAKFDTYDLSLEADGVFNAAKVTFLVRLGTHPDGRTFRVLPVDQISAQPMATTGTPEIQGWDLQFEPANVDTDFTQTTASIRVEFGKQKGAVLPGRIYFCVPAAGATIAGTFNATIDQ